MTPAMRGWLLAQRDRLQPILAPGLKNSQFRYYEAVEQNARGSWLDLGCGRELMSTLYHGWQERQRRLLAKTSMVVGVDLDSSGLARNPVVDNKVLGTAVALPFRSESFDLVTANMVVEHLAEPGAALREIWRVLKPGGDFVFHTPNLMSYAVAPAALLPSELKRKLAGFLDGRQQADIFPTFYRMNTRRELQRLAAKIGFLPRVSLVECSAQSAMLGPVVVGVELCLIRALRWKPLEGLRTNIVAVFHKP